MEGGVEMREKEKISIETIYASEISDIKEILDDLEARRTTEFHENSNMYGSIETKVADLRKKLTDLMHKISKDLPPDNDDIGEIF